ncbi:MAG: DUF559 domain-containing protein [Pirellulales bacterium]
MKQATAIGDSQAEAGVAWRQLERHRQRRAEMIPTVSVLAGGPRRALELWREWTAHAESDFVLLDRPEVGELVRRVVRYIDEKHDVLDRIHLHLGRRPGWKEGQAQASLAGKTCRELQWLLEATVPDGPVFGFQWLCGQVLRAARAGATGHVLQAAFEGCAPRNLHDWIAGLHSVRQLAGAERMPAVLLLDRPGEGDAGWLETAGGLLTSIAGEIPSLTLALITQPAALSAYLGRGPDTRQKAMLKEGVVEIAPGANEDAGLRPAAGERIGSAAQEAVVDRLGEQGAGPRARELWKTAYEQATAALEDPDRAGGARSAAEQFLYDRLETHPNTAGLFVLNGKPELGADRDRAVEIDLVCEPLRIAIEVDGYYHFRDADAYRRDRRKDLRLQKQGFVVIRCLAIDVVTRLEDILADVAAAVAWRRD